MTDYSFHTRSWRINAPNVISETVDGESIAINLENGMYYTFNAAASYLWQEIGAHICVEQLASGFSAMTNLSEQLAMVEVQNFIESLTKEFLIRPNDGSFSQTLREPASTIPGVYESPAFIRYEDLNALLLADPIHDVGDTGWPQVKNQESAAKISQD